MSNEVRTGGIAHKIVLTIPVSAYAMAQKGRASGSFPANAAVPNPCALCNSRQTLSMSIQYEASYATVTVT